MHIISAVSSKLLYMNDSFTYETLTSDFVFLDEEIDHNLKITCQILRQFCTMMYLRRFYKSNKVNVLYLISDFTL